jgi:uncharacterized membrane protein
MLLSVTLAFVGYSLLNISQAVQKMGLQLLRRRKVAGGILWGAALLASGLSFGVVFRAIAAGNVSVVGAMAGTGLVSLSIFARFAMSEGITLDDTVAIAAIVVGSAGVALFPGGSARIFRPILLWGIPVVVSAVGVAAWLVTPDGPHRGAVIGGFSGFLGAYSQLFQKTASAELDFSSGLSDILAHILTDPMTLVWVAFSFASMVVIQFAYRHAEAIRIIPPFTALFIVTPVLGGVLVYGEKLTVLQWVGIAVILAGSLRLSRGTPAERSTDPSTG